MKRLPASLLLALCISFVLTSCTISVKKGTNEEDKNVDIETPFGGIHVSKDANTREIGLPIYPGAILAEKDSRGNDTGANVNVSTGAFGVKVEVAKYQSDAAPEKLIAYYKDKLKNFGNVLVCHAPGSNMAISPGSPEVRHNKSITKSESSDASGTGSATLACEYDKGENIELKAGTPDNQHIVSIESQGGGSKFALVLVQRRGQQSI